MEHLVGQLLDEDRRRQGVRLGVTEPVEIGNSTNLVISATTAKEKATSKTTAGTFTQKRRQNSDTLSLQESQKPLSHWDQLESHPENEIYFKMQVYTIVCCLSVVCCLLSVLSGVVCMCLVLLLPA